MYKFNKKGKLTSQYISWFEIKERIGPLVYLLELSISFSNVYKVFHISTLRKYILDPYHVLRKFLPRFKPL